MGLSAGKSTWKQFLDARQGDGVGVGVGGHDRGVGEFKAQEGHANELYRRQQASNWTVL